MSGFVLPIIRLIKDEAEGYKPEVVTRKLFELKQYEYASAELAGEWSESNLGFLEVRLPDLDHDAHKLMAIMPSYAIPDFKDAMREFNGDRSLARQYQDETSAYGYSWAPGGQQLGYGYHSPVDAWMVTNSGGSIFLYRPDDTTAEDSFHVWMQHWIQQPMPKAWPRACKALAELVVPVEMRSLPRLRSTHRHKPRPTYGVFR